MVFVELTPFIAFRDGQWSDEELHGKRGGARVIYYRHVPKECI